LRLISRKTARHCAHGRRRGGARGASQIMRPEHGLMRLQGLAGLPEPRAVELV
jgi:hypothetical protein